MISRTAAQCQGGCDRLGARSAAGASLVHRARGRGEAYQRTSPMLTVISDRPSGDAGTQAFRSDGTPAHAPVRSSVPTRGSATVARPGEHSRPTSPTG